jgi:hypothetical protein
MALLALVVSPPVAEQPEALPPLAVFVLVLPVVELAVALS